MTKPRPEPTPVPMPIVPEGAQALPVRGRRAGSQRAIIAWAIVSAEDFDRLNERTWSFAGRGYVRTAMTQSERLDPDRFQQVYLHQAVLSTMLHVDHINGDKLDNRRENLRPATNSQNHAAHSSRAPGASGVRGVVRGRGCWTGRVTHQGTQYRKSFQTIAEAKAWRDKKAVELFGEFAAVGLDAGDSATASDQGEEDGN